MCCLRTLLFASLVIATDASAQVRPIAADGDSTSMRELITLEYHLNDLLNRGDWEAYAPHLAEDYRQTNRSGEVRLKRDVIDALQRQRAERTETTVPDSIEVRIYGDTGVLTAVLTGRSVEDSRVTFRSRILKTFVRREDRWYMVAMQGTPIS